MKTWPGAVGLCVGLAGCAATGPLFIPPKDGRSGDPLLVVYRTSRYGGAAGTWVPVRLEIDGRIVARLPDESYVSITTPAGARTVSATPLINVHYSGEYRVSLQTPLGDGEVVYVRIASVFGQGCAILGEPTGGGATAYGSHRPRVDWVQSTCLQRVPEALARKELEGLKRAE